MASSRNNPSTDALTAAVRDCLHGTVPSGARVAVALSGGLDSSVLLALAASCAERHVLSAAHVHHGLNPRADAWVGFCEALCHSLGIPLQVIRIEVPRDTGEGLEAAARRLRYQALDGLAVDHVLLAHHANDQAETVLLNLLRGAGVKGAAAMQAVSGDSAKPTRYLRPLLGIPRADLEAYAGVLGQQWIDDDSNADTRFSRNYLRAQVVPLLEERFPGAVANLGRAAEHFAEAQAMLDEMAMHDLAGQAATFPVAVDLLAALSPARAANVLRHLLGRAGLQAPTAARMKEALRQFLEAAPDRHPSLDLPAYRLYRQRRQIQLEIHSS